MKYDSNINSKDILFRNGVRSFRTTFTLPLSQVSDLYNSSGSFFDCFISADTGLPSYLDR